MLNSILSQFFCKFTLDVESHEWQMRELHSRNYSLEILLLNTKSRSNYIIELLNVFEYKVIQIKVEADITADFKLYIFVIT